MAVSTPNDYPARRLLHLFVEGRTLNMPPPHRRATRANLVHVSQGELEGLVGQDAGRVGKAQQAVVGEHRAQAQGARVQQRFMRLSRRQLLLHVR